MPRAVARSTMRGAVGATCGWRIARDFSITGGGRRLVSRPGARRPGESRAEVAMRRLIVWAVLAGLVAAVWAAVKFLPWWALVLAVVGSIVLGKWLIGRLFTRLLTTPFKLKGAVLRGATVEVHFAEPAQAPPAAEEDGEPAGHRRFVRVDLTVTPAGVAEGPFQMWEPGELRLVREDVRFDPNDPAADEGDEVSIRAVEVFHEGAFQEDDGWKLPGAQRLRLLLAVQPGLHRLKFRYYFEEFGELKLPPEVASAVA